MANVSTPRPTGKAVEFPAYEGTREAWANEVLRVLQPRLADLGITMPEGRGVRIGVTPLSRGRLGECHPAKHSVSGNVNFIGLCTKQADAAELVHTLIHEYIHAADDCQSGHRNRWAKWAGLLGMKAKGHERNALAQGLIRDSLMTVGIPQQHEPSQVLPAASAVPSQIHGRQTLLCLDAGRGGLQYRRYCRSCWSCTDGPISHDEVTRAAVAGGRRPKLHVDGSVIWAPIVTTGEIERRRTAAKGRR